MKKLVTFLGVIGAVILARLLPFNWIVGSYMTMFSWSTIIAPVIAVQAGLAWVLCMFFSKKLLTASSLLLCCAHRLPLLCASRAFMKQDVITSVIVPLFCIVLFVTHAVGMNAWMYSVYWLIPIALYMIGTASEWSRALTASFVAHAVGSIVWLYTGTISAEVWMSLIPIVACERLLMAGGMVACNRLCNTVVAMSKQIASYFTYPKAAK